MRLASETTSSDDYGEGGIYHKKANFEKLMQKEAME